MNKHTATGYQKPHQSISDLIDMPLTPGVSINPTRTLLLLMGKPSLPSLEEVAQPELRLAGLRINPKTNGSSRSGYYNGFRLKSLSTGVEREVTGLPEEPRIENISWASNGKLLLFTITVADGMELWLLDTMTASVRQLTEATISDTISGSPCMWLPNGKTIVYKSIVENRGEAPLKPLVPDSPTIQTTTGVEAAVRTYQDLLKSKYDEALFEYYATSQLRKLNIETGEDIAIGKSGNLRNIIPSPNGEYFLVLTIKRPFSYLVPYSRFPFVVEIWDQEGKIIKEIATIPVAEDIPKGFGATRMGRRNFTWRADKPASLYWVEAQDEGNPRNEVAIRDQLFYLETPFQKEPTPSLQLRLRYGGIIWGDGDLALVNEWWWQNRQEITSQFAPDDSNNKMTPIFDRSWEDRYNDPGSFQLQTNEYSRRVLMQEDGKLFLIGQGASPEGNQPFVDEFDIATKKSKRLWQSEAPFYEAPFLFTDLEQKVVLTSRESETQSPNYFFRYLKTGELKQITTFPNPYQVLENVKKELIKYERADGVELMGTLYLPPNYNQEKEGKLPALMWAYPREYKSKTNAGQVKDSPYRFIRINSHSPIYWVLRGYAVFDDFSMPIIGEGEEEPNETFVEQLVAGAEAAVEKLDSLGIVDRKRIAVGGHSYGAFMTANLLAHTDLFAAGIARSGAYNRTLTPFGFQSEERTFWEATDIYVNMSPFVHANKIKSPILLIHGAADNNSGTYPMQSERFYTALKGHGATARLVMLPHESHGYRAKESILHMLWEMDTWLEKYV